jgi:hypothetical protein
VPRDLSAKDIDLTVEVPTTEMKSGSPWIGFEGEMVITGASEIVTAKTADGRRNIENTKYERNFMRIVYAKKNV